jgi:hypothetical protein
MSFTLSTWTLSLLQVTPCQYFTSLSKTIWRPLLYFYIMLLIIAAVLWHFRYKFIHLKYWNITKCNFKCCFVRRSRNILGLQCINRCHCLYTASFTLFPNLPINKDGCPCLLRKGPLKFWSSNFRFVKHTGNHCKRQNTSVNILPSTNRRIQKYIEIKIKHK